jgi:hypothetical protein
MLNAKLADFAMNLEHAEEQIWRMWAMYQGQVWDGYVEYSRSFSIQDKFNDINMLKLAKEANVTAPGMIKDIDAKIYETIFEEEYEEQSVGATAPGAMVHGTVTSVGEMVSHLREMYSQGYTDEQILALHPELSALFGNGE